MNLRASVLRALALVDPQAREKALKVANEGPAGLTTWALPVYGDTVDGNSVLRLADGAEALLAHFRGDGPPPAHSGDMPTPAVRRALAETRRLSGQLRSDENRHRLSPSREPDEGFVPAVYRWATTGNLAAALAASDVAGNGSELPAGDFVRWCRQVLDLLDQVRNAAPQAALRKAAKRAIDAVRRGVVAVDSG